MVHFPEERDLPDGRLGNALVAVLHLDLLDGNDRVVAVAAGLVDLPERAL